MTAAGHAEKLALLLVDDHELILLGIRQSLEREGTAGDLVAVRSAAEALQALRSRRFDLCVVDLELPDLPGFELIDAIRRQDPAARIVVNTMHNEIWTVNRLLQSGVQGMLYGAAGDDAALSAAILQVLALPDHGTALGTAAQIRARVTHDAAKNTAQMIEIYRKVLQREGTL